MVDIGTQFWPEKDWRACKALYKYKFWVLEPVDKLHIVAQIL